VCLTAKVHDDIMVEKIEPRNDGGVPYLSHFGRRNRHGFSVIVAVCFPPVTANIFRVIKIKFCAVFYCEVVPLFRFLYWDVCFYKLRRGCFIARAIKY